MYDELEQARGTIQDLEERIDELSALIARYQEANDDIYKILNDLP
jgi:cell division septum initiation protein DivIVA